jgi:predicted CXXCH cytochrome family protein
VTRRLAAVIASCLIALCVGAAPAAADNGPHVRGAGVLADSCAGCHRVHTAKSDTLTAQAQPNLCYTCHGADSTGAATDVEDGVLRGGAPGQALRGGGFAYALIGSDQATGQSTDRENATGSVPVLDLPEGDPQTAVTSTHNVDGANGTAYGSGPPNQAAFKGATIQLRCGSCHDPHGNGNYRILRDIPLQSDAAGVSIPETPGAPRVYATGNYWSATDVNEPRFIENIAAWCSTCHTRYLAPADAGVKPSGDMMFKYRHRSDSTIAGRTNCIQCHVAHGSNAQFDPASSPGPVPAGKPISSGVVHPDDTNGGAIASDTASTYLLRIDNRGTCFMCHGKPGP